MGGVQVTPTSLIQCPSDHQSSHFTSSRGAKRICRSMSSAWRRGTKFWHGIQISHRGKYSVERLQALDDASDHDRRSCGTNATPPNLRRLESQLQHVDAPRDHDYDHHALRLYADPVSLDRTPRLHTSINGNFSVYLSGVHNDDDRAGKLLGVPRSVHDQRRARTVRRHSRALLRTLHRSQAVPRSARFTQSRPALRSLPLDPGLARAHLPGVQHCVPSNISAVPACARSGAPGDESGAEERDRAARRSPRGLLARDCGVYRRALQRNLFGDMYASKWNNHDRAASDRTRPRELRVLALGVRKNTILTKEYFVAESRHLAHEIRSQRNFFTAVMIELLDHPEEIVETEEIQDIRGRSSITHAVSSKNLALLDEFETTQRAYTATIEASCPAEMSSAGDKVSHQQIKAILVRETLQILFFWVHCARRVHRVRHPAHVRGVYSVVIHFPNAEYHPETRELAQNGLVGTMDSLLFYSALEFLSFLLLNTILARKFSFLPLYQLAFMLENQMNLLQAKIITYLLFTFQFTLDHLGADFTFQFLWPQSRHDNDKM